MNFAEKNIENIIDYFWEGCKKKQNQKIGIEIEHFILHEAGENALYEEVVGLMKEAFFDGEFYYEKEALISCKMKEYLISLEPAAQLEISINPKKNVRELEQVYEEFLERLESALKRQNLCLKTLGYQPAAKVAELPLIPKKRYEYMDAYFRRIQTKGIRMMRGSASTQAAVDYMDEEDFVKKYQLAQILSPVLALLCENTPVVEGETTSGHLARAVIWNDVDEKRCGILQGSMREDFSFRKYAEYVYRVPLIFVEEKGKTLPVGEQSAEEYYKERLMTREEIEHMLSMVFPDVRLKNYIEIRMADSLPKERAFSYVELIQEIFYGEYMEEIREFLGNPTEEEIAQAKEQLIKYGEEGSVYGRSILEIYEYLERIFPEPMQKLLRAKKAKK